MNPIVLVARALNRRGNEGMRNAIHALMVGRPDLSFSLVTSVGDPESSVALPNCRTAGIAWVPHRNPRNLNDVANFLAFWLQAPWLMLRGLQGPGPRVVHFHCWMSLGVFLCLAIAKISGSKIIWTMYSPQALARPYIISQWLLNLVDVIAVTNRSCLRRLAHDHLSKTVLIPPSVDIERFSGALRIGRNQARESLGLVPDSFVVAYVGHVLPGRGIESLLAAHHSLRALMPSLTVRTVIASSGVENPRLIREIDRMTRSMGLASEVIRLGFLRNIAQVYRAADAVVLPLERFGRAITPPLVCIEACLAGSVVMVTRFAGDPEELSDLLGGRVLVIEDPRDIAIRLKELAEHPNREFSETEMNELAARWQAASLDPYSTVYGINEPKDTGLGI